MPSLRGDGRVMQTGKVGILCQGCARVGLDGRWKNCACASQITVATRKVGVLAVSEGRAYAFLGCA